jgi:hypothetical protein
VTVPKIIEKIVEEKEPPPKYGDGLSPKYKM